MVHPCSRIVPHADAHIDIQQDMMRASRHSFQRYRREDAGPGPIHHVFRGFLPHDPDVWANDTLRAGTICGENGRVYFSRRPE